MDLYGLKKYKKEILLFINTAKEIVSKFEGIYDLFIDEKMITNRNDMFSVQSMDNEYSVSDCDEKIKNQVNLQSNQEYLNINKKIIKDNLNYQYINYENSIRDHSKEFKKQIKSNSDLVAKQNNINSIDIDSHNLIPINAISNDIKFNIDKSKTFEMSKMSRKLIEKNKLKDFFKSVIDKNYVSKSKRSSIQFNTTGEVPMTRKFVKDKKRSNLVGALRESIQEKKLSSKQNSVNQINSNTNHANQFKELLTQQDENKKIGNNTKEPKLKKIISTPREEYNIKVNNNATRIKKMSKIDQKSYKSIKSSKSFGRESSLSDSYNFNSHNGNNSDSNNEENIMNNNILIHKMSEEILQNKSEIQDNMKNLKSKSTNSMYFKKSKTLDFDVLNPQAYVKVKCIEKKKSNFDDNDKELTKISHLLFELKNYPKSLVVIDQNMKIIQYNDDFCRNLFWDRSELHNMDFSQILQGTETLNQDDCITEIFDQMNDKEDDLKEVQWLFYDKERNKVKFNCRFKISKIEDENDYGVCTSNLIIFMDSFLNKNDNPWIINPKGPFQLCFSLVIGIALIFLVLYVPYDISFGSEFNEDFNQNSDMVITLIFTVDIIFNFFVAQEDNENKMFVYDNYKVAQNYLTGSFVMDMLATIPLDRLFNFIAFNTSIIKSIRIFKVIKLVKILRISKQVNFIGTKNVFDDNEFIKDLILELKRNSGQFELMLQNSQILIGAHFQTILFKFLKDTFIEQGNREWVQVQYSQLEGQSQFNIYLFLLSENVKTALGLGVLSPQNPYEILLNLSWMFVGLSLFGYGIGNISSYLNNVQQDELEYQNAIQFFQEMCDTNEVDPRIHQLVLADLDEQQSNAKERRFQKQGKMISHNVLMQLETSMYKDFVDSYPLFGKLSIQTIRIFKNQAKFGKGRLKVMNGSVINDIIFILKGKITVQDDSMQFINEYKADEVQGMQFLKSQINLKQKIDLSYVQEKTLEGKTSYEKTKDMEKYLDKIGDLKNFVNKRTSQARNNLESTQTKLNHNTENTYLPRFVEEDTIRLIISNHLVASADMEYITMPFKILEEIFLNDMDNFNTIWKQNLQFLELITKNDKTQSRERLSAFNSHVLPGLMLTKDCEIQEFNKALYDQNEEFDICNYVGVKLNDLILLDERNESRIMDFQTQPEEINWWEDSPKDFKLMIDGREIIASLNQSFYTKIVRDESKEMLAETDDDINFYHLRKSILDARVLHFEIIEIF